MATPVTAMIDCRWVATDQPRALISRHIEGCAGECDGCEPCTARHCGECGVEHVSGQVLTSAGEWVDVQTCPRCIGATRADLADIVTLYALLPDQAIHHATAAIPGGNATVMLAPGSMGEAQQWAETYGMDTSHKHDERQSDPVPPLLTLATWEDDVRDHRGDSEGPHATVESCVDYLSRVLHEVAQTHDGYGEFAADIRRTRSALESTLLAGNRAHEGARCLNEDCGALLRQPYIKPSRCTHSTPARAQLAAWLTYDVPPPRSLIRAARVPCGRTGCDQGGRRDDWRCPACKRRYSDEDYRKAVAKEHAEQRPYMTGPQIAKTLGILPGRVRMWAHLGHLDVVDTDSRGRKLYDLRLARALAMRGGVAC